jgi:hypothetical protein
LISFKRRVSQKSERDDGASAEGKRRTIAADQIDSLAAIIEFPAHYSCQASTKIAITLRNKACRVL